MSHHAEFSGSMRGAMSTDFSPELIKGFKEHRDDVYESMHLAVDPGWENDVERVVTILSASRSGSSLIFDALAQSGEVIAPAGEHEPWLYLSGNKWPFVDSDRLDGINERTRLLNLIRNDLLVRTEDVNGQELGELLWNRAVARQLHHSSAVREMVETLGGLERVDVGMHQRAIQRLNHESLNQTPLVNLHELGSDSSFIPIENPPFIEQPFARRAEREELADKTLLFKSPSDAYRPGLYEKLFPNAEVRYVHLTRGFAQTVNGLMDGWSKNDADFISNAVGFTGSGLSIAEYSDTVAKEAYWCFDLYPGWQEYTSSSLVEVCAQQWLNAHQQIIGNFAISRQIKFESFYTDRQSLDEELEKAVGVDLTGHDWQREVMSTERPSQFRWKKRSGLFRNLHRYLPSDVVADAIAMQEELGYSMEESTWH